ncbi:MAG: hypothetical protein ACFFCE_19445 [Promethearchaeota archaeon]
MIEEPFVFLGVLFISLMLSYFLSSNKAGLLRSITSRLFFIGVCFHEMSHYVMCLLVGIKPEQIKIKWRNERFGFEQPHGNVKPSRTPTFMQALLTGLAPLVFSTWFIFFFLYGVVLNTLIHIIFRIIAIFIIISLFTTAAPSAGDLQYITSAFRENPSHSFYQVLLVSISICILWVILILTHLKFILDVFYYLTIAGIYLILKYSLIASKRLITHLSTRNYCNPSKVKMRPLNHKHYKPQKPIKRL